MTDWGDGWQDGYTVPGIGDLKLTAAFGFGPLELAPEIGLTDLTDRLHDDPGITWSYGRQTELDRIEAGVGSLRLDNRDRALDPEHVGSPFWPDVRPCGSVSWSAAICVSSMP